MVISCKMPSWVLTQREIVNRKMIWVCIASVHDCIGPAINLLPEPDNLVHDAVRRLLLYGTHLSLSLMKFISELSVACHTRTAFQCMQYTQQPGGL